MKRAARAVLTMLTVLSLLLAILVAGAWGRSYWRWDSVTVESRDGLIPCGACLPRGELRLAILHADTPGVWEAHHFSMSGYRSNPASHISPMANSFIGLGWEQARNTDMRNQLRVVWTVAIVMIRDAYLLTLFAALPAIRFYRRLRRRGKVPVGCCRQCGYDLRASPDRCPECGTAVG